MMMIRDARQRRRRHSHVSVRGSSGIDHRRRAFSEETKQRSPRLPNISCEGSSFVYHKNDDDSVVRQTPIDTAVAVREASLLASIAITTEYVSSSTNNNSTLK